MYISTQGLRLHNVFSKTYKCLMKKTSCKGKENKEIGAAHKVLLPELCFLKSGPKVILKADLGRGSRDSY